ncbi:Ig-like domain-containing protein [Lentisphaerota bacterium ZTH]|nr:cadherin-like domain-containing protein [Lentisphaerota bacterium]WET05346.1 Ig-like domain-containing protein [Lentisphaerota bacterium ZTH]
MKFFKKADAVWRGILFLLLFVTTTASVSASSNIAASFNVSNYWTGVISVSNIGSKAITLDSKVTVSFKSKVKIDEARITQQEPMSWVHVDLNSAEVSSGEYSNTVSFQYGSDSWINKTLAVGKSFGIVIAQYNSGLSKDDISSISVNIGESVPVAHNISKTTAMNTPVTINILEEGMCTGDDIKLDSVTEPLHGKVQEEDSGIVQYTPDSAFTGQDVFNYTIIDKAGKTAQAKVTVTINNPATPPVVRNAELITNQNTTGSVDLSSYVSGGTAPYTYYIVTQPSDGNAAITNTSLLKYTPNDGFYGSDSVSYKVIDANSLESNTAQVSITVKSTQLPLTAGDLTRTVTVNSKLEYDLSNLVSGGISPYTFKLTGELSSSIGNFTLNGSTLHFVSNGSTGTTSMPYSVTDNAGSVATGTVTVKVDEAAQKVNATYWCAWGANTSYPVEGKTIESKAVDMDKIDASYNVIITAFIVTDDAGNFELSISNFTKEQIKNFIKTTKAQGRKVIVSIGGALFHYTMTTETQKANFIQQVKSIIDEYGFEGLDIDIEGSATGSDTALLGSAIKDVVDYYRNTGMDFWLTAAPEWCYITPFVYGSAQWPTFQLANTFYKELITNIGIDNFTYIWPQTYNQGSANGVYGPEKDGRGYHIKVVPGDGMDKFLTAVAWAISTEEGYSANGSVGVFIPQDKLALGIPATEGAAGGAMLYVATPELITSAVNAIRANQFDIAGFMNWSVDWDALDITDGQLSSGYTHSAWSTGKAVAQSMGI